MTQQMSHYQSDKVEARTTIDLTHGFTKEPGGHTRSRCGQIALGGLAFALEKLEKQVLERTLALRLMLLPPTITRVRARSAYTSFNLFQRLPPQALA